MARHLAAVVLSAAPVAAACGQKGPPLPPLRAVPAAATELRARRVDTTVHLSFIVPTASQDAQAPLSLDRVDVYARSALAGGPALTATEIVGRDHLVGSVPIGPPVDPDGPPPDPAAPPDPRPRPGDTATFSEVLPAAAAPVSAGRAAPAGTPLVLPLPPSAVAVPFVPPPVVIRYYVLVGVTGRGRNGVPSARLPVQLAGAPAPPVDPRLDNTDTTLMLTWTAPAGTPVAVYASTPAGEEAAQPVQAAPITTGTWSTPVVFGEQRCFTVRRVRVSGNVSTESPAAGPVCRTPEDTYPPPVPANLRGVAEPSRVTADGVTEPARVTIEWTPVVASDLAGYVVLRGDEADPALRELMAVPITANVYADTTARPDVVYTYVVVAVDQAGNRSAPSTPVSVRGRDEMESGR